MEILTEDDIKWKGIDHYEKQKKKLNDKTYALPWWSIYSKRNVSGPCMKTCSRLKPIDAEDFYNRAGDICDKLKKENMERIAIKWKKYCGEEDIPLSTFYDTVVCHNIIETFRAKETELMVANMMRDAGFEILPTTEEDDAKRGIDIFARKDGKTVFVQVKVISYLFGNKYDLVSDRIKVFTQYIPNQKETYGEGIPYYWIFYDYKTKEWIWNPETNSFKWDSEKLLNKNGIFKVKDEYAHFFKDQEFRRKTLDKSSAKSFVEK